MIIVLFLLAGHIEKPPPQTPTTVECHLFKLTIRKAGKDVVCYRTWCHDETFTNHYVNDNCEEQPSK